VSMKRFWRADFIVTFQQSKIYGEIYLIFFPIFKPLSKSLLFFMIIYWFFIHSTRYMVHWSYISPDIIIYWFCIHSTIEMVHWFYINGICSSESFHWHFENITYLFIIGAKMLCSSLTCFADKFIFCTGFYNLSLLSNIQLSNYMEW
jgi:hypothetical protein